MAMANKESRISLIQQQLFNEGLSDEQREVLLKELEELEGIKGSEHEE